MTKFFLLDDDPSVTEILSIIIKDKELGVVADICHNPMDALDSLEFSNPDIIIVDLLMPDMDGIKFVKKAKEILPKAYFIMLSQVSDKNMVAKAYQSGIEYFIQKPVNVIEVINIIQKVVRIQSLERTVDSAQNLFSQLNQVNAVASTEVANKVSTTEEYEAKLRRILQRLGIIGERGSNDIIQVVCYLCENESAITDTPLSEICNMYSDTPKSMEQRIRRAATSCLSNIAHMGLDDYGNEVFEEYSASLFKFEQVRKEMDYIKGSSKQRGNVQIRKFLTALVNACKEE